MTKKKKAAKGPQLGILHLDILDILQKHTDDNHSLIQKDIMDLLKSKYGYDNPHRGTIRRKLEELIDYQYYRKANEIHIADEIERKNGTVQTNFYYEHTFTHEELYLIIDSLLFSKHIPSSQRVDMIKKLEGLTSNHFHSRLGSVHTLPSNEPMNKQLFNTIGKLDDAIRQEKQITFYYQDYTIDEKSRLVLTNRTEDGGKFRKYTINPYHLVATNGRYYLICNYDKYHILSHYRVDRILRIAITEKKRKPIEELHGLSKELDLAKYMREHIYMFAGETITASIRFEKRVLGEFIDWFGTEGITFSDQTDKEVTASARVNRNAIRKWALQYGLHVRVLSPDDLVKDVKKDIQIALSKYDS